MTPEKYAAVTRYRTTKELESDSGRKHACVVKLFNNE
jgi:hypothetical protein